MLHKLFSRSETLPSPPVVETIKDITSKDLASQVVEIDLEAKYPDDIMRRLGKADAYNMHLPGYSKDGFSLKNAIQAMQTPGEVCMSTSFCIWCQDALGWYIFNSDNENLKNSLGMKIADGSDLGGTGLSNPMKSFSNIEKLRLSGKRVDGGYIVKGLLPWVSNLGDDHYFGAIFSLDDDPANNVMAVIDCSKDAVKLSMNTEFVALDGTRTYAVQVRNLFIPDDMVLAHSIADYLPKIRAGFVLLQAGMAFGIIQSSIDLMLQLRGSLGHINKYLEEQPEAFQEELNSMQEKVWQLCETPHDPGNDYWREVLQARLAASELTVKAAHAGMLHSGARGYVNNGEAQRRLREAYFVAIVTPATKHLRKLIAEMAH